MHKTEEETQWMYSICCNFIYGKYKAMKRKIYQELVNWKDKSDRMPLIVNGARQVGKSYILQEFGQQEFDNYIIVNLEIDKALAEKFDEDLTPAAIIRYLETVHSQRIIPGKSLVVLDEIQACERALTSLKYFCEQTPEYHIVAAGSLLGVAINREKYSFPVGKVYETTLFPMDFEEFLWALGRVNFAELIREHYESNEPLDVHAMAVDFYNQYLIVGGMPAAVKEFINTNSFVAVADIQNRILNEYIADMVKYAEPSTSIKIRACYESIPAQLAKENHKFQYSIVQRGGSAANLIPLLYWKNENTAEVDFVIQKGVDVIPVEVKSGVRVRSKSMHIFRTKYKSAYGIRISKKNFGFENGIKSVPLYAAFCIR